MCDVFGELQKKHTHAHTRTYARMTLSKTMRAPKTMLSSAQMHARMRSEFNESLRTLEFRNVFYFSLCICAQGDAQHYAVIFDLCAKNMRHHYKIHSALAALIGLSFFVFQIIAFVELNGTDAIKNYKTFGIAFVIVAGLLILADIAYIMWQRHSKQTVALRALHPYEHRSVRSVFFIAHLVLAVLYSILFIRFADHYDTDSGELEEIGYDAFAERQFILGSFAAFIPLVAFLTIREVGYSGDHQKHGYVSAQR